MKLPLRAIVEVIDVSSGIADLDPLARIGGTISYSLNRIERLVEKAGWG